MSMYALYVCAGCRDEPREGCGDGCAFAWPDELAPVSMDYWPVCRCCGEPAQIISPLVPIGG